MREALVFRSKDGLREGTGLVGKAAQAPSSDPWFGLRSWRPRHAERGVQRLRFDRGAVLEAFD